MPLSIEKLQEVLRRGDVSEVCTFFLAATESERTAVAATGVEWCKILALNWRAQFNKKAAAEIEKLGPIENWHKLMPAAHAAALASATLAEIKSLERHGFVPPETAVVILTDRRPLWIDDYAELLCEGELRTFGGNWKQTRALVRAGLCQPPKHDHYVLEALNGIWPRYEQGKDQPKLVDLLLKERDWLDGDFWRLFEVDGNGEVSLANCEKYPKSKETWTQALAELSRLGVLSRDRLLDASLEALSRDFIQFRACWFSRFHEALEPTFAERAARIDVYLRLLGSSIPPTVAFAIHAVAVVDRDKPLAASELMGALQPQARPSGGAQRLVQVLPWLQRFPRAWDWKIAPISAETPPEPAFLQGSLQVGEAIPPFPRSAQDICQCGLANDIVLVCSPRRAGFPTNADERLESNPGSHGARP